MTTHETLKAARALIATPERWTREKYFGIRREDGSVEGLGIKQAGLADCYCSVGAIAAVSGLTIQDVERGEAVLALEKVCRYPLISFNDTSTHAEILAAFDKAIEATKEGV